MSDEKYYSGDSQVVLWLGGIGSCWNFGLSAKLLLKQTLKWLLTLTHLVTLLHCVQEKRSDGHSLHYLCFCNKIRTCIIFLVPALLAFPFVTGMKRKPFNHEQMKK